MTFIKTLATSTALVLLAGSASATTVTSLVGDIDGFGGQTAAGAIGASTGSSFDNTSASDPAFTDVWLFEQDGGVGGSPVSYTHSYTLGGAATSATLEIMESGMADGRGPWNVLFNGNLAGDISSGASVTSMLRSFSIDVSWLTGSDAVSLVYLDNAAEGYAIDYSQLSIETSPIPVPAAGFLLLGGLGGLAALRRRKKS